MTRRFDYFVIFAEMRTGSNFLEASINEFPGLTCYGEAYNPYFIGRENQEEFLGITMDQRETDPLALLDRMRQKTEGLAGFRFFNNHDPRMLEHCLNDKRCAKIILTRNPVDSFISRRIAHATGIWRLGDLRGAKTAKVKFNARRFNEILEEQQNFQLHLMHGLQTTGQTAFYVDYEDLRDIEVINGLAAFLEEDHRLDQHSGKNKVQNPAGLEDKVENYDEMKKALSEIDRFDLGRTPNFEPRRSPGVPTYVAAARAPLLFQPLEAGPSMRVFEWLAAVDGVSIDDLQHGFSQKSLRQWKRQHKGHRSFTVLRHPVRRLHAALCKHFLNNGPGTFFEIRETLRKRYKIPLPEGRGKAGEDYSAETHKQAMIGFANFVYGNLNGQTSVRIDSSWASQAELIKGMAQVSLPDMVLREDGLGDDLAHLAAQVGVASPDSADDEETGPIKLSDVYDAEIEDAVKRAYQKDYMMFGFGALGA